MTKKELVDYLTEVGEKELKNPKYNKRKLIRLYIEHCYYEYL